MRGPNRSNDGTLNVLYKNLSRRYIVEKIVTPLKLNSKNLFRSLLKTIFVRMRLKRKVIIKSLHLKNDEIKLFRLIKNSSLSFKAKVKTLPFFFEKFLRNFVCSFDSFQKRQNFCFIRFFSAKKSNFRFKERMQERKMMNQNTINLLSSMWVFQVKIQDVNQIFLLISSLDFPYELCYWRTYYSFWKKILAL